MASAFCFCHLMPQRHEGLERRGAHSFLLLRREALPDIAVDDELEHRIALVHARRVVILEHRGRPRRRSSTPPTHSAQSITPRCAAGMISPPGRLTVCHAHALCRFRSTMPVCRHFRPLKIGEVLDRPLEPAERLRARAADRERHDVELDDVAVELPVEVHPAAFVEPAEEVEVVHAERTGGRRGEQRRGLVLADPVVGDAVAAIDHLLVGGVEDFERRHDLAGRERLDLDLAAGQLVDPLGEPF